MGGYSSGRYRERNRGAFNAQLRLDIRALRRQGFLRPGAIVSGGQTWRYTSGAQDGTPLASAHVTSDLADPARAFVVVQWSDRQDTRHTQRLELASRPMRYGGQRWYFVCPRTGARCELVAIFGGLWASRQAHRLTYQSQSSDRLTRLRERAWKLDRRLRGASPRSRPRGRNRQRLRELWIDAEMAAEELFSQEVSRRFGGVW